MVSLTNQARLLAAQEFNRRVIAQKLAAGKNVSRARFGVLTGRVATVDPRTKRVTGISRTKSRTAIETDTRLRNEIRRQRELAQKETDLEKFLKNERTLRSGNLTGKQVRAQIAARKKRGLSKTPAQRAALARVVAEEDRKTFGARARRKGKRGVRPDLIRSFEETRRIKKSEAERAFGLGSSPFADPSFEFGGRSREEVIKRGGIAGRRAAGESLTDTLDFVRSSRLGASRERIGFAQGLLGGFGGRSTADLLSIVGSQRRSTDPLKAERGALTQIPLAPATFAQRIRAGEGFFTTEAIPFTEKDAPPKSRRQAAVRARKVEDLAKATKARRDIARQSDIERITVLGSQIIEGRRVTSAGIDPIARREAAQATQRETDLLRSLSFGEPIPVRATGFPTTTQQPFVGRQFQLNVTDTIGIRDTSSSKLRTAQQKLSTAKARGKAATTKAQKEKAQVAIKKQQAAVSQAQKSALTFISTPVRSAEKIAGVFDDPAVGLAGGILLDIVEAPFEALFGGGVNLRSSPFSGGGSGAEAGALTTFTNPFTGKKESISIFESSQALGGF